MRTGRPPLSDEEKRLRGTFDPRYSAAERSARTEAKVVSLFGSAALDEVPPPPAGISGDALVEYQRWTRRLHECGRLTQTWVDKVTFYAARRQRMTMNLAGGKAPTNADLRACELFMKELSAINVDQPRPQGAAPESKWGRIQIATRKSRSSA